MSPTLEMLDLQEIRSFVEETAIAAGSLIRSAKPAQLVIETKKNGNRFHHPHLTL